LHALQAIEADFDRVRHEHWGPRTLDLDIIDVAGELSDTEELKVPHPYALLRDFVVTPLLEIAPGHVLANGLPVTVDAVEYGAVISVDDE
jgi:2-amino-4-hydroxy-6-hydroxymethyldihydropteridine diphosphokinase